MGGRFRWRKVFHGSLTSFPERFLSTQTPKNLLQLVRTCLRQRKLLFKGAIYSFKGVASQYVYRGIQSRSNKVGDASRRKMPSHSLSGLPDMYVYGFGHRHRLSHDIQHSLRSGVKVHESS